MSFDDEILGKLFPTRQGEATGSANERQMLDKTGAEGFHKSYRTMPDGSITRCETRNGMPRFFNSGTKSGTLSSVTAYMESGKLEFSFPGDENPTRFDPATWHLLDVASNSRWLGEIKTDNTLGDQSPAQSGTLYEGMDSLAIGYPKGIDDVTEAMNKASYGDLTMLKKIVVGWFPPSLFSGKMRLFMQAQYGARETMAGFHFTVDVLGESVLLYYGSVQLGLWAHNSPGIFTAPDGTFWLVVIRIVSGTTYAAIAYRLTQDTSGNILLKKYIAGDYNAAEKDELEAYIFAHSRIDTESPRHIGVWDATVSGSALAYGWKWNSSGSEASVVIHDVVDAPVAGKHVYRSHTLRIAFSYANGNFSMTGSAQTNGDWCDGWGAYNIFVPEREATGAPLVAHSLFWGAYRDFSYSFIPIYGYYIDDAWTPLEISRTYISHADGSEYTQISTGITYPPDINMSATNLYQYGYAPANQSASYEGHDITESTTMTLAFADQSYSGESTYGTHTYVTRKLIGNKWSVSNPVSFLSGMMAPSSWSKWTTPPGYPTGTLTSMYVECSRAVWELYGFTGGDHNSWALAIPDYDAEAAYVAKHHWKSTSSSTWSHYKTEFDAPVRFYGTTTTETYSFSPWATTGGDWSWYGISQNLVQTTDADPIEESETFVYAFNSEIKGEQGTPGGSYYTLFNVDLNYPYYDRGMTMYTSHGGKYEGSELTVSNPPDLPDGRFVGWT